MAGGTIWQEVKFRMRLIVTSTVGGPQDGETVAFTGEIDEFAAWDLALTQIEIEQQYRSANGDVVSTGRSGHHTPEHHRFKPFPRPR